MILYSLNSDCKDTTFYCPNCDFHKINKIPKINTVNLIIVVQDYRTKIFFYSVENSAKSPSISDFSLGK